MKEYQCPTRGQLLWCAAAAAPAKLLQSGPTLCDPVDGSPPGSSIHGIFQARVLQWGAIAFYMYMYMYTYMYMYLVAQSCPTVCNSMDCSLPSSSVHRILQVRILEWVAIPFSRGSSQPSD